MIRGMWSPLSLFEDFLWAKHDSFIYPLSEENSIFSCNKKGLQWLLRLFQICEMSHDGSDTSPNTCPSWRAEWMSTAEHRPRVKTFEALNVMEILDLKQYIWKMWNKPGSFPPKPWSSFFKPTWKLAEMIQSINSEEKNSALPFLLPEIFVLLHQKCRSINGDQIHKEFIENTSWVLTQCSCNSFLCYPCKIKKYSEPTLLRDCYSHHEETER